MAYKIKFDDITSLQLSTQATIRSWGEGISSINAAMSGFIHDTNLQGQTVASIGTYLSEVHGTLLQTLMNLMNEYSTSLLLYKDGYYTIDSDHHTVFPEQVFTSLQSDLKNSHAHFQHQIDRLNTAKSTISDLVGYSGTSHTRTTLDYHVLLTKLQGLDEAIKQYESHHVRQDLTAFKELLSATQSLISEYSGKPRSVGTYQSGDLGKLTSIERFATAYHQVEKHLSQQMDRVQAAQDRDQARFEALAAEDRANQGWVDLALSVVTIAVGVAAIVCTGGAATPLVVWAWIAGSGTVAYGLSNLYEAGHDLTLGYAGDGHTVAVNPIRDTLFMGNDKSYHQVGGLFTTASAIMIPIGQTQSVTKGLVEFAIGEVGGFVGGQVAYHGTRLLGGSESDVQRASFVGSFLGGFAASSAATKFSLNKPAVNNVTRMKSPYRQQVLKNIEESKLARESSNFNTYLKNERFTRKVIQTDYIQLSENLGEDLLERGYKIVAVQDAQVANVDWADLGFDLPPIANGTKAYFIEAGNTQYSRVFKEGKNYPVSRFILKKSDIEGLTAVQIYEKYALPFIPDKVVNIELPPETILEASIVGPQKKMGDCRWRCTICY